MKKHPFYGLWLFFLLLSLLTLSACDSGLQKVSLGSGNLGGLYYKFATDYANKINGKNGALSVQVKTTAGTRGNMRLMKQGFVDAAIVQSDVLKDAIFGNGEFHKSNIAVNFAALGALYTEAIQIVTTKNSGIENIQDLIGKKVSVGEEESGIIRNAKIILDAYGISFSDITQENLDFSSSARALKDGDIDAFFCTAGFPTPTISELSRQADIRILSIDSTDIKRIERQHSEFIALQIPANTYNNQEQVVNTIGMKAILIANLNIPNETARALTAAIFETENTPDYNFATTAVPAKFHPGATSFYESKGLKVSAETQRALKRITPSTGD